MPSVRSIRQALRGGATRTAAIALSAAVVGGGTVAALDGGAPAATATAEPAAATTRTVAQTAATDGGGGAVDFSDVYARRRAGVVSITATVSAADGVRGRGGEASAGGSGVVIDDEGHVLTNEHVVEGASGIEVEMADGTTAAASVVGSDASTDLAVLRIDVPADRLQPIPLGDSASLEVGEPVLAIGDPFGYAASASAGIVSGLDRGIPALNGFTITGAIQTDAAVNHGNSGGALLDAEGELVGVPAQIADSGVDANVGVAFAIPVDTAARVIDALLAGEQVAHAWLGVQTTDADDGGALVTGTVGGGPAEDAGVGACEVVTAVDGSPVADGAALQRAVDALSPGDRATLTVRSEGGAERPVAVTLGDRSDAPDASEAAATPVTCG